MRALPPKVTGAWIVATCDESVQFKLRAMTPRHQMFAAGQDSVISAAETERSRAREKDDPVHFNVGSMSWAIARMALMEIRGLEDHDGSEFKLKLAKESIGGRLEKVVTVECMERIPAELVGCITVAANDVLEGLTPEETEETDFISDSVVDSETNAEDATETKASAISDAEKG